MSLKRQYPFPYKTVANDNSLDVSSISIENITIQSPSTYPTYTLTLPINTGSAGQVLTTNGSGVLSWSSPVAGVTSVTASLPLSSSGGATPDISLGTVPTTLGGTGLTTVGTNGQVLTSNGTNLSWQSPTGGTVTSVSASVPSWLSVTVTNPTTTPAIAITGSHTGLGTTVVLNDSPFIFKPAIRQWLTVDVITPYAGALGKFLREYADPAVAGEAYRYIELGRYSSDIVVGSDSSKFFFYRDGISQFTGIRYSDKMFRFNGLANFTLPDSEGTNGQILSTDGTGVTSWINNQVGTVTSVSASVPSWLSVTVTNPTSTPAIAITGSATGTGTVSVLQDSPTINNTLTVTGKIAITRNNGNGEAISILNAHNTFPVGNWISMGYNGNAANQAHFGFWSLSNGSGYAYIQTNGNRNFVVDNDGRIGVRVTNPTVTVDVYDSPAVLRLTSANQNPTTMILTDTTNTNVAKITMTLLSSTDVLARNFQIFRGTGGSGTDYIFSANVSNQVSIGAPTSNSNAKFEVLSLVSSTSDDLVASFASLNTTSRVRVDISKNFSSTNGGFLYYDVAATGIIGLGHSTGGKLLQFDNTGLLTVDKVKAGSTTILGAGTYTITLPPTAGTNGQVLTTNGSGTLSWTTPTTGTVTSVSATSPLASSGGSTPTISISSSTGTGAVMLANYPTALGLISDNSLFTRSTANDTYVISSAAAGSFGYIEATDLTTAVKRSLNLNPYGGNVGIGTTAPSLKFHVVNGSGDTGIFEASTNYGCMVKWIATATNGRTWKLQSTAIGDGEHPAGAFVIDDGTAGVRRFVINDAGNISIGVTAAISSFKLAVAGAGYFNLNGQNLVLDGSTSSYLRWRVGANDYGQMGYTYSGSKDLTIYNQRTDGHIILDVANTGGAIRCAKNILLQETVYIKIGTASSSYDFILPTSPGTAGQYLISGGAGSPMYWGTGGGGGGGTVNSVTASSPLASSGGTSPNISISSATGTGAVVLANNPTVTSDFHVSQTSSFGNNVGIEVVRSGDPTPANNVAWYQYIPTASADYRFYNTSVGNLMTLKANGNVGLGTTSPNQKLEVYGTNARIRIDGAGGNGVLELQSNSNISYIFTESNGDLKLLTNLTTNKIILQPTGGNVGIGTTSPAAKLDVNGAVYSNLESHFSNGTYSDPDSGNSYTAKFGTTSGNGIAVKGNSKFTNSVIASNFTTNSTNYFSYESVTANFDMAIYYTLDGKCYDLTSPPAGRGAITIAYASSSNTVTYTRIGRLVTIVIGVEYSYVIPAFQTMADCKICLKLPAALAPLGTGSPGSNGSYPSRIDDAFVVSYGFKYWLQSVAYNGGGFVPIIMLFRNDNSHDFLQWDNNNKSGQKVYLTMSYLVNSA